VKYTFGHGEPMTLQEIFDALKTLDDMGVVLGEARYSVKTKGVLTMTIKELEVDERPAATS
jgi:hypothetical protein